MNKPLSWISTVSPENAEGIVRQIYDAASKRTGGPVPHIVQVQSPNPGFLQGSMQIYMAVMFGPSPLSRTQREMLAVITSQTNGCHY